MAYQTEPGLPNPPARQRQSSGQDGTGIAPAGTEPSRKEDKGECDYPYALGQGVIVEPDTPRAVATSQHAHGQKKQQPWQAPTSTHTTGQQSQKKQGCCNQNGDVGYAAGLQGYLPESSQIPWWHMGQSQTVVFVGMAGKPGTMLLPKGSCRAGISCLKYPKHGVNDYRQTPCPGLSDQGNRKVGCSGSGRPTPAQPLFQYQERKKLSGKGHRLHPLGRPPHPHKNP